jgi:hypothetical protein
MLCDVNNFKEFALRIQKCCNSSRELKHASHEFYLEHYSAEIFAAQYTHL